MCFNYCLKHEDLVGFISIFNSVFCQVLCELFQSAPQQSNVQVSGNISGFIRRLFLQLMLEDEKVTVFLQSPCPVRSVCCYSISYSKVESL